MTKMKKLFAVVLALAMLLTMASFSASAEDTTSVDMTIAATTQTNVIKVIINGEDTIGGLTANLAYDKNVVAFAGIEEDANNAAANTVKDDENGNVSIVLLGSDLILKFKFISSTGNVSFTLDNIVASNAAGTAKLTAPAVTKALDTIISDGNTIRNTDDVKKQDLGFVSTFIGAILPDDAQNVKLGFLAIPTALLNGPLEVGTAKAVQVEVAVDRNTIVGEGATGYIAYITGFLQGDAENGYDYSRMGRKLSGRFYVSYNKGADTETEYFYGVNTNNEKGVTNGVVSKSFVGTCKAMATELINDVNATPNYETVSQEVVNTILDPATTTTNNEQKEAILKFVISNGEYFLNK